MLTNAQKVTLKNAVVGATLNMEDYGAIADWLNDSTAFVCWKSTMTPSEARKASLLGISWPTKDEWKRRDRRLFCCA